MANKLKYAKAADLADAIDAYFDSISAIEDVQRVVFCGTDENGKKIYTTATVYMRSGEPMQRTVWYTPPTVGGLCLHLGITRKTLGEYARRGGAFALAVERARSVIAAYLEEKISDPDIRNVKGVQLALESLLAVLEEEARATKKKLTTADYTKLLSEAIACGFIGGGEEEADADENE